MKEKLYNTLPYLILVTGLIATLLVWQNFRKHVSRHKEERLRSIERQTISAIRERIGAYVDAHYAASGLFLSSEHVTHKGWREFVESISLHSRYRGINGLGYALPVNKKDSAEFVEYTRADEAPGFSIRGFGLVPKAEDFFVIKYIEPEKRNMQAVGFDMGSEPVRRKAMEEARDQGKPIISGKVILVQDTANSPGFLMYVPFYKNGDVPASLEQKRLNFIGWIYSPFIASNFFNGVFSRGLSEINKLIYVKVYDGPTAEEGNLLFRSEEFSDKNSDNNRKLVVPVYNLNWTIILQPTESLLEQYKSNQPIFILISGFLLSIALYYIAFLVVRTRRQAMELAEQMTSELRTKTAELEKKNLELKRSNNDLEQFAYVASHDLKEPLRMVSAYTQLLASRYKNKLDEDGKTYLAFASEGASRMGSLINDLLNYSRLGNGDIELITVDVNAVIKDVIKNNEIFIEETGTSIHYDKLPEIKASENYLYSLFQNLISNAIKFKKPDSSPVIHINVERKNKSFWQFSIKDNGIGIDQDYLDKIFVIFQRLHTRDKYEGTGIGLAICKKIVEFHGGKIWVESKPGEGTTIFFTLPALKDKEKEE